MARAAASPASRRQMYADDDLVMVLYAAVVSLQGELDALYAKLDTDATIAATDFASTLQTAARPKLPTVFDG